MKVPRISVLVSTYNAANLLPSCLDNVIEQTVFSQCELIVIDSGSTQNESDIVKRYRRRFPSIRYLRSHHRETLYAAWNRGIRVANGEYLINANTDDRSRSDAFEILADALDANSGVAIAYSDAYLTRKFERHFPNRPESHWKRLRRPDYSHTQIFLHGLCGDRPMWRRRLHEELGYFDASYLVAGDREFWMRVAEHYPFLRVPEPLYLSYRNPKGLYWSNELSLREVRRALEKFMSRTPREGER